MSYARYNKAQREIARDVPNTGADLKQQRCLSTREEAPRESALAICLEFAAREVEEQQEVVRKVKEIVKSA